jgi:hypothetical protein
MDATDMIFLLATGLLAAFLVYVFARSYSMDRKVHDIYYMMGFAVLLVSVLLLILLGYRILTSPWVMTIASLIPLGVALGLMNQYWPEAKKVYSWFALIGIIAIVVTSFALKNLRPIAVSLFHGVSGLIIFLLPFKVARDGTAPKGFWWVGVGGGLVGLGGIALAFITMDSRLRFVSGGFAMSLFAPLLLLMAGAYTLGFTRS